MNKKFEVSRKAQNEWRSQHEDLVIQKEEDLMKRKRSKTEVKRVQTTYIKAVTKEIYMKKEETTGKSSFQFKYLNFMLI